MQGKENVLLTIETLKDSFTKTEKKIATFVVKNPQKVVYMSLTEVSDILKVSEGSIVRFCQKLGYTGFHPFKIALAVSENQESFSSSEFDFNSNDLSSLKNYVAQRHIDVIKNTSEFISEEILESCVEKILTARTMLISGVGASGNTAHDAFYKFMRIGLNCKTSHDAHIQAMIASELREGDVLLAISQSGSTLEIVDIADVARKGGATVIAITGYARSPLARFAHHVLLTPTRESPFESGALRSKIAQLYVLELLFTAVFHRMEDKGKKFIEKTADSVAKWIY